MSARAVFDFLSKLEMMGHTWGHKSCVVGEGQDTCTTPALTVLSDGATPIGEKDGLGSLPHSLNLTLKED